MTFSWLTSWWVKLLILLGLLSGGYYGYQLLVSSGAVNTDPSSVALKPELTEVPPGDVNCDCDNVSFGLLTAEFRKQCEKNEADLKRKAVEGGLRLKTDADGILIEGDFCDTVSAGPNPWPVAGVSINPPARPESDEEPCDEPSGLVRGC